MANGECQTMRLTWPVVGILSEDDDSGGVERCAVQSIEHLTMWWVDNVMLTLAAHELLKSIPVRFGKFIMQGNIPLAWHH